MALKRFGKDLYWKMPSFLRKSIYNAYSMGMKVISPLIVSKINKGKFLNKRIEDINDIIDAMKFVFSFKYLSFSIKTSQVKYEISTLLEILKDLKPKTILEIGTAGGGSLFLYTRVADLNAILISVDLPGGEFGGGYAEWKIPIYQSFAKRGQRINLLRVDSHNPRTLEKVKKILDNKKVDFLFIDGDHSYEGVKKDFNMYSSLVRKGGIIAFHDIVKHPPDLGCEVDKSWNEIKNNYKHKELIGDKNQTWAGIGVLYL